MNYDVLIKKLPYIDWFSNVGEYKSNLGTISIPSLEAWDNAKFNSDINPDIASIAANMDWLPTTRDQECPMGGSDLDVALAKIPGEREKVIGAYKVALKSLRSFDEEKFKNGNNDFSESAKGGALYCTRMVAKESLLEKPGFWTNVFLLYVEGYWPCGLVKRDKLVVF